MGEGAIRQATPARDRRAQPAPSVVHAALREPGVALGLATRSAMSTRFHHDFSQVRVHAGPVAARSAAAISAEAYAVGGHVVLGAGPPRPGLLEHELAHVTQQGATTQVPAELRIGDPSDPVEAQAVRAERDGAGVARRGDAPIVRRSLFSWIGGLVSSAFHAIAGWSKEALERYVQQLAATHRIEGDPDSDDKARAVIAGWMQDRSSFKLTPELKRLLVEELLDGPTTEADELGIMDVLESASQADLDAIFAAGSVVTPARLRADIDAEGPRRRLETFLAKRLDPGGGVSPGPVPQTPASTSQPVAGLGGEQAASLPELVSHPVPGLGPEQTTLVEAAIRARKYQDALDLFVRTKVADHTIDLTLLKDRKMTYDATVTWAAAATDMPRWDYVANKAEPSTVRVGPSAFSSVPYLYSVVMHEYQHVLQRQSLQNQEANREAHEQHGTSTNEVEAYAWELEHAAESGLAGVPDKIAEIWESLNEAFWEMYADDQKRLRTRVQRALQKAQAMVKGTSHKLVPFSDPR